jgi:hypothetical protein
MEVQMKAQGIAVIFCLLPVASWGVCTAEIVGDDFIISGCNVHIRDGSGDTDGAVNGLGNLIVGYNEAFEETGTRTGSHNVVVGMGHTYKSYAGIVTGEGNWLGANAEAAGIIGGETNKVVGAYGIVTGGRENFVNGSYQVTVNGMLETIVTQWGSISGGISNYVNGDGAWVGGGKDNQAAQAQAPSISGGEYNSASGNYSSVLGGVGNSATAQWSSVSGGTGNVASGQDATVAGGRLVTASGTNQTAANYCTCTP